MALTSRVEDYLETIYLLSRRIDHVGISDVARELGVSLPTVKSAVSRLKENGLVCQKHYGKILLNPEGEKKGAEVYHAHTTLRDFLHNLLKRPLDIAEEEACRIEHVISRETLERLETFMQSMQKLNDRNRKDRIT